MARTHTASADNTIEEPPGLLGGGVPVVGGLLIVYSIVSFLFVQHTAGAPGWTSIMAAIAILGAVQLLVLGIIGEYVGRILRETRRRPRYVIAETEAAQGDKSEADHSAH